MGDKIPIQATIYRKQDGTSAWEFNLSGIYDGAEKATEPELSDNPRAASVRLRALERIRLPQGASA